MRIDIRSEDSRGEAYLLGTVELLGDTSERDVYRIIGDEYVAFLDSDPECDSDFVDWLADKHPAMFAAATPNMQVTV